MSKSRYNAELDTLYEQKVELLGTFLKTCSLLESLKYFYLKFGIEHLGIFEVSRTSFCFSYPFLEGVEESHLNFTLSQT